MREKDFQVLFSKWIKAKMEEPIMISSAVFELKLCKGKSLPFNSLRPHQMTSLVNAKHAQLYHKINDMPFIKGNARMRFTNPKPFDCFLVQHIKAFVVIMFYIPRKLKEVIFVDIDAFLNEQAISKRKSLTLERAQEIGSLFGRL